MEVLEELQVDNAGARLVVAGHRAAAWGYKQAVHYKHGAEAARHGAVMWSD